MLTALSLETAWTAQLRRGERPSREALLDHLREVHRRFPGFTESCAGRCRGDDGRTSYAWLADLLDPARHRRVLDLCCGSGPLLSLCAARLPEAELIGLDASASELALAERRVPEGRTRLLQGLAQDLSMIEDGAADAVLCHWALTLLDPVEPVLQEVKRVLAPGGLFAAVVDGPAAIAPGYREVDALIFDWVKRTVPGYGEVDLGDPRIRTGEDLASLLCEVFDGADIAIDGRCVRTSGPPADLAEEAAGFFYAAFVLAPEDRRAMLGALSDLFETRTEGEEASFALPINVLQVRMP